MNAFFFLLLQSSTQRAAALALAEDTRADATSDAAAKLAPPGLAASPHAPLAAAVELPLWPQQLLGAPPGLVIRVPDPTSTRVLISDLSPGALYTARIVVLSRAGVAPPSSCICHCAAPLLHPRPTYTGPGAWSPLSPPIFTLGPLTVVPAPPVLLPIGPASLSAANSCSAPYRTRVALCSELRRARCVRPSRSTGRPAPPSDWPCGCGRAGRRCCCGGNSPQRRHPGA